MTRSLRKDGFQAERIRELLIGQTGDSGIWPDDAAFREAWLNKPLFGLLNNPRLVYIYTRLNQTYMSSKSETVAFPVQPSIEHIMPQSWISEWPLPDGTQGMGIMELWDAELDDPRAVGTRSRDAALQTLGNLTLLSTALNSSQSNFGWDRKRPEMMKRPDCR